MQAGLDHQKATGKCKLKLPQDLWIDQERVKQDAHRQQLCEQISWGYNHYLGVEDGTVLILHMPW